ncbi:uncharacterized protein LOC142589816 isoform X2 [Dermacentor variabilis]|uniref:uncharacterized protein LOC142589816 isoform X2 n=1 Tax=Dermacentor variabilis TaxID=34621 RepID=UPI003F5C965C
MVFHSGNSRTPASGEAGILLEQWQFIHMYWLRTRHYFPAVTIGGAGRAGCSGEAVKIVTRHGWKRPIELINILEEANQAVPAEIYPTRERPATIMIVFSQRCPDCVQYRKTAQEWKTTFRIRCENCSRAVPLHTRQRWFHSSEPPSCKRKEALDAQDVLEDTNQEGPHRLFTMKQRHKGYSQPPDV